MRPITDVLREVRQGRAVHLASQLLAEVVQAVDQTGKAGEVTITIKVKPEEGGGSQKRLAVTCKAKRPTPDIAEAVFFSDPGGDLHRSDPQQGEMFTDTSKGAPSGDLNDLGRGPTAMAARAG